MSRTLPSNTDDVLDSRDIDARIAELQADRDRLAQDLEDAQADPEITGGVDPRDFHPDEADDEELTALQELREQGQGYSDWKYGVTLVRDSYFEEYAKQLAEEMGLISGDESWPLTCIDWERATRELQQDYTSVEYDGVTYWFR